jgi:hypothetical protein
MPAKVTQLHTEDPYGVGLSQRSPYGSLDMKEAAVPKHDDRPNPSKTGNNCCPSQNGTPRETRKPVGAPHAAALISALASLITALTGLAALLLYRG